MIDLHCHLDLYKDALTLLPQVASRNLFTLVVTTSPKAWLSTSRIFAGYENIEVAVGLHPEIVGLKARERELLMSCIAESRFVGEVGVDGSRVHQETISLQVSIFQDLLIECEKAGGRIISVHSRNAVKQVLDLIEQNCFDSTPILHWFSGTIPQLHRAIDLGCWFSVGPAMLMGLKGIALLREMPIDRVLPESDGPFTTFHSEPLMPWDAIRIVETLESIWGMSKDRVYSQMELNLNALIR
jgi:TatD DNase family protein